MPTLTNKGVTFGSGESLPQVGSSQYTQAQNGALPTSLVNTTLDASSIASATPLNVPQPQPLTPPTTSVPNPTGTTLGPNGQATVNPPAPQPAAPAAPAKSAYQSILDKIQGNQDVLATKGAVTQQLQQDNQLDQKTQKAAADYNAYNTANTQYQTQLQQMQYADQNVNGAVGGGYNSTIERFKQQKTGEVANLAIAAQASQGLLTAAQATIKNKLDAQFEPVTQNIDYLTKFAQLNQNDLSESDKAKLQQQIDQQKTDKANVQTAAQDIHDRLLQNNAPPAVYSAIDKVVGDFTSGKISAQDATNQMYQATGGYGATNKYSVVTNPFTGVQSAFDVTTGQFKGQNGQPINPGVLSTDPTLATSTINKTAPVIDSTTNMVTHPPTGNVIVDQAQQLVDGNAVPNTSGKLTPRDLAIQQKANELSIAQTGKPYSAADAAAAYKFRNSSTYQKFIANAPVAMSTINQVVDDAKKLNLKGPDIFNSLTLKTMASGLNPFVSQDDRATAKELINTLGSISADDIGLLLGSGSGSDYKTKLGGAIFDVSGNLKTTEQIAKTVNDRIQSKLNDYYRIAGVKDPSIYATRDSQAITGVSGNGSGSTQTQNNTPVTSGSLKSGITFKVIQ